MAGTKAAHETRGRGHRVGVGALRTLGTVTVWILVETGTVVWFLFLLGVQD